MDKPSITFPDKQTAWGTWEELLLACAVHRYGTENWSSVVAEVQKRSPRLQLLTPRSCQQKYHDLQRRFARNDAVSLTDNESIPWLDDLKKLRVAELKRELQRYDLSIVSLQLKVKRLTEEREQNEEEKKTKTPDQVKTGVEERAVIDNGPESLSGKPDSGEESDRENGSVNESNSTDPKAEDTEKEPEPAKPVPVEHVGEDVKAVGEDSSNGSCGSAAKESARKPELVDSPELGESVAESIDGGEVESSVSLLTKEEEKIEQTAEPENEEDRSPAAKLLSVESQPLMDCLEIIRSHKFGSLFERFDAKEKPNYRNLIRQHIDLETIRTRLEESWYSGCNSSFFRDLLLLFNNSIIFFSKKSSESTAAIELRQIVLKEVSRQMSNSSSSPKEQSLVVSPPLPVQIVKLESLDSLPTKSNILAPLIACRKRSSITAKRSMSSALADKKKERREQTAASVDKNSFPDSKQQQHDKLSRIKITKKRTRERSAPGKSGKIRGNAKTRKNSEVDKNAEDDCSSEEQEIYSENSEGMPEKERKNKVNVNAKKRSAANFLSRMKLSSLHDKGSLLETLKREKAEQKKKNESGKVDAKKEQISRKRSGGKGGKEKESPAKRNGGRPVTRATTSPSLTPAVHGKRRRESVVETEGRGRKRSRK